MYVVSVADDEQQRHAAEVLLVDVRTKSRCPKSL